MRVKKLRSTVILIAFGLCILGLTGCQRTKKTDDSVKNETAQTPEVTAEATGIPNDTDEITETPEVTKEANETIVSTYEPGTLSEEVYESKWLNLRFTPPENVTLATKNQMDTAMNNSKELLSGSISSELLDNAVQTSIYEMMAIQANGFPNVTVTVEDAPSIDMDAVQYFTILEKNLEDANLGHTYGDISEGEIAGQTYTTLNISIESNNTAVTQTFYLRRQEDKFVTIIVNYTEDTKADVDALMAGFSALQ